MAKIENLTMSELKDLIGPAVEEKLLELLGDPNEGLDLKDEVKTRLKKSLSQERKGAKTISAEKLAKNWVSTGKRCTESNLIPLRPKALETLSKQNATRILTKL